MSLDIYVDPCTINCRKVLAGLDLIGTEFNEKYINYFKAEQKSEAYTKINPMQTIPAAVHDGFVIPESNAILQYAADHSKNESVYPKDLKTRADVNRWLLWEASVWFQTNYKYVIQNVVQPLLGSEPDKKIISDEEPNFHKLAGVLDAQLAKTKFVVGSQPTIADIAIAAPLHLHYYAKAPLDQHPNVARWIADVEQLPSWKKTEPAVLKAFNLQPRSQTNGAANGVNGSGSSVQATFNYTKDVAPKLTELYFYDTPKAAECHEPGDDPVKVSIHDGWSRKDDFTLDKNGFAVEGFKPTYNQAWEDEEKVRNDFYPEVVEFIKKTTGAKRVLVFDHTIRTQANSGKKLTQETNTSQRAPVMLVHCDYTNESGPTRVKQLLPDEADDLLKRRVSFINVWKPLNTVEERPLAMCDATTGPPEDFFKLHLRYRDRNGENYVMKHSDAQKWYYFPGIEADKVILLKTYESESENGMARFVGHTAFEDPTTKEGAKPRESVEIRTIAFY